jgi:starch phosphorylase
MMNSVVRVASSPIHDRLPVAIEGFDALMELSLDVRWSWNHGADAIWTQIDAQTWGSTHSPCAVLQNAAHQHLARLMNDAQFREQVLTLVAMRRQEVRSDGWFQRAHSSAQLRGIAYFSMEFMLCEALPIYAGGLGNVAGDLLKAAGDLGVPVTGIGLLYSQGYFRQVIDQNGQQQAVYPFNDPGQLPVTPLRDLNGDWLRFQLELPGHSIWLRAWQVRVGRLKLYLLDSNDAANPPTNRGITSELYGGGAEMRLQQELVLGLGGWRLLQLLGEEPEVCHLNEGHAAFAVLERARSLMMSEQLAFDVALTATRAGNIFTTHTAVAAGFDRFDPQLIERYLGSYARSQLGISLPELLALGRLNAADANEPFSMAYLAMRGCRTATAVSRLHEQVSRRIFAPLFPRWPLPEVPVGHVTNGVHMPSWDSAEADALWTECCGKGCWTMRPEGLTPALNANDEQLWKLRSAARASLIDYARERLSSQLAASGAASEELAQARESLDPEVLTLGFARRFVSYKRPNLLLYDPERLLRLLNNPAQPLQIIIAGKAHPDDVAGQAIITQWIQFIRRAGARARAIFLADADMLLTERLVQGVDVWLNTPRRPWEASGTSGMKVLVNGGINLSELDGWWAEAYTPEVGWALGDGCEHEDMSWDAAEADALYRLLEQQIIPEFYRRDSRGIPLAWIAKMRHSMSQLTPQYSSARAIKEYVEKHYLSAAVRFRQRTIEGASVARRLNEWQATLAANWRQLQFGKLLVHRSEGARCFSVPLSLAGLQPDSVQVELYAEGLAGQPPERHPMRAVQRLSEGHHTYMYRAEVRSARTDDEYTPRALPQHPDMAVPMESNYILWQR